MHCQQTRDPHAYPDARQAHSPYERTHHSPVVQYAHRSPLQRRPSQGPYPPNMDAVSRSPVSPTGYHSLNRASVQPPPPQSYARRPSIKDEVSAARDALASRHVSDHQQAPPPCSDRPFLDFPFPWGEGS